MELETIPKESLPFITVTEHFKNKPHFVYIDHRFSCYRIRSIGKLMTQLMWLKCAKLLVILGPQRVVTFCVRTSIQ